MYSEIHVKEINNGMYVALSCQKSKCNSVDQTSLLIQRAEKFAVLLLS